MSRSPSRPSPLKALVPSGWRKALGPVLDSPAFEALEAFLDGELEQGPIYPPRQQIFRALSLTPLEAVKVVIIGQDPYPTAGNANGLAFSVASGMKVPASLKNVFAGLSADLGVPTPSSGDLTPWAERGVLLLNTVLTVREKQPNSHRKKGWEAVTQALLEAVNRQPGPCVFLCFGVPAKHMAERLVDTSKHRVLTAPHPSPLNGKAFVRAVEHDRHFSKTNAILMNAGRGAIDWSLP